MTVSQKIYFLSDFHLGAPDHASSVVREKRIVRFLEQAARDATEIHILGDLFDMWFEYKQVVPRGFSRLLGKLADLHDRGIPVHIHIGNHDMWAFDYLPQETGVTLHQLPIVREWNGKRLYIGHGDGLGPADHGYKFMKGIFRNPFMQWCFARLHPNLGLGIAHFWSGRSRKKSYDNDRKWLGDDREWLVQYGRELLKNEHYDFFIFGHRHLPVDMVIKPLSSGSSSREIKPLSSGSASREIKPLSSGSALRDPEGKSRYINLGDWITWFTYAVFDENGMRLMKRSETDLLQDDRQVRGGPAK